MIARFVICALGSADLVALAVASIEKFAGDATVDLIQLRESALGDPNAHGRALDQWRLNTEREPIPDEDVVVIMDPDAAITSPLWRKQLEYAMWFPQVGIWGAGCKEDFGARIHPLMMAIRGKCFNEIDATFRPFHREGTFEWRDTAGWYCKCALTKGWTLRAVERFGTYQKASGNWWRVPDVQAWVFGFDTLFVHLGGGTWSDPTRLTWWQRQRRRRALRLRRRYVAEVRKILATPTGPRPIA
jgi:hypothetical protein